MFPCLVFPRKQRRKRKKERKKYKKIQKANKTQKQIDSQVTASSNKFTLIVE